MSFVRSLGFPFPSIWFSIALEKLHSHWSARAFFPVHFERINRAARHVLLQKSYFESMCWNDHFVFYDSTNISCMYIGGKFTIIDKQNTFWRFLFVLKCHCGFQFETFPSFKRSYVKNEIKLIGQLWKAIDMWYMRLSNSYGMKYLIKHWFRQLLVSF